MSGREERAFEDEVRRIARHLWPEARYAGGEIVYGRERDGVFVAQEVVHIVEATTSRKLAKAKDDIKKSIKLASKLRRRYPMKVIKCWFITRHEPTAHQRGVANKHQEQQR
jgi:hypothetical protein